MFRSLVVVVFPPGARKPHYSSLNFVSKDAPHQTRNFTWRKIYFGVCCYCCFYLRNRAAWNMVVKVSGTHLWGFVVICLFVLQCGAQTQGGHMLTSSAPLNLKSLPPLNLKSLAFCLFHSGFSNPVIFRWIFFCPLLRCSLNFLFIILMGFYLKQNQVLPSGLSQLNFEVRLLEYKIIA